MRSPSRRARPGLRSWAGRVLAVDEAGADVVTGSGRLRATWGAGLLVASAAGPPARRGDAVQLLGWPDGRVTVEQVLLRLSA